GQGSINVTSSPACVICAPAYPPTAPAPTMAIFLPMGSSATPATRQPSAATQLTTTGAAADRNLGGAALRAPRLQPRLASSSGRHVRRHRPAVHRNDRAAHVVGIPAHQKGDDRSHILRLGDTTERRNAGGAIARVVAGVEVRAHHGRVYSGGRHRV